MNTIFVDRLNVTDKIYDDINQNFTVQPKNPLYWVHTIPCHLDLNPKFTKTNKYARKQYRKRK